MSELILPFVLWLDDEPPINCRTFALPVALPASLILEGTGNERDNQPYSHAVMSEGGTTNA